jgi:PAS domain S-box-containing protein
VPRAWTAEHVAVLHDLAATASVQITLRRQAEALREALVRQRAVLDAAQECIVAGTPTAASSSSTRPPSACSATPAPEVVGREIAEVLVPPARVGEHRAALARAVAVRCDDATSYRTAELPVLRADGTELHMEVTFARTQLDGRPLFTAFMRDLRDRDARREAELRFRTLVEHAPLITYSPSTTAPASCATSARRSRR